MRNAEEIEIHPMGGPKLVKATLTWRNRRSLMPALAVAALTITVPVAAATPLETLGSTYNATASVKGYGGRPSDTKSAEYSKTPLHYHADGGTGAQAFSTADDTHGGTASVSVTLSRDAYFGTFDPLVGGYAGIESVFASASLSTVFQLLGPVSSGSIPVLVNAGSAISGVEDSNVPGLFFSLIDTDLSDYRTTVMYSSNKDFALNQVFDFRTDHIYTLSASVSAGINGSIFSYTPDITKISKSLTVDPLFTIQDYYANDYHFVGLPASAIGSPASSAVPEPACWAMMIVGFGAMGAQLRRRRQTRVALPQGSRTA